MPLVSDLPEGAPDAVAALAEKEPMENHADELADLLRFLGENFVEADNGDLAVAIPTYDSPTDVDSTDLARKTTNGYDAVVIVDGELQRCTE